MTQRSIPITCFLAVLIGSGSAALAYDRPSAIVVYPYVATDAAAGIDTTVQLTNVSDQPLEARCFYEDLTPDCVSGTAGESCGPGPVTCSGSCVPRLERRPFRVRITPRQPLAWRLSEGLVDGPIDGIVRTGPQGASNQLTDVPAVSTPMVGTLRCVVVGADGSQPEPENALVGLATVQEQNGRENWQYRALGLRALTNGHSPNHDEALLLGGPDAEYESCPALISMQHFFDAGPLRTGDLTANVHPGVVLATCTAPLAEPGGTVAQFLVFNEFSQRFSTSRPLAGQLVSPLALIDTSDPARSIFAVGVSGTLAGHTQIRGIGSGLVALATDDHVYAEHTRPVGVNVHGTSTRVDADYIAFRAPRCTGDCDLDGTVRVNELVTGVGIALGQTDLDRCQAMDENRDVSVKVNELVSATNATLYGCPTGTSLPPTPTPSPRPTQISRGELPEITLLGLTTADDRPLEPDTTDDEGRPVFERPYGQGMTILIEARSGASRQPIGQSTYRADGSPPDLQLLISNPLGDGAAEVCEEDGRSGGVPGNAALEFNAPGAVAAINDLGCRAFNRTAMNANQPFTRPADAPNVWRLVDPSSELQFGIPISKAWAFPVGDTTVAARVRDVSGALSAVEEIVIRVAEP